jgi:hypothetical protein
MTIAKDEAPRKLPMGKEQCLKVVTKGTGQPEG